MKCPDCGGTMEEGFRQSSHPVAFVKQQRWVGVRSTQGDFRLPFSPLRGSLLAASFCSHCGKIIISLKEEA